jgi:hypothetical protein
MGMFLLGVFVTLVVLKQTLGILLIRLGRTIPLPHDDPSIQGGMKFFGNVVTHYGFVLVIWPIPVQWARWFVVRFGPKENRS